MIFVFVKTIRFQSSDKPLVVGSPLFPHPHTQPMAVTSTLVNGQLKECRMAAARTPASDQYVRLGCVCKPAAAPSHHILGVTANQLGAVLLARVGATTCVYSTPHRSFFEPTVCQYMDLGIILPTHLSSAAMFHSFFLFLGMYSMSDSTGFMYWMFFTCTW